MNTSDSHRLDALLSLLVDQQLTDDEQATLTRLLRDDPEARSRYQDHIELHAFLRWRAAPQLTGEHAELPIDAAAGDTADRQSARRTATPLSFLSDSLGWLAQQGVSARTLAIVIGLALAGYFGGLLLLVAWQSAHLPAGESPKALAKRSAPGAGGNANTASSAAPDFSRGNVPAAAMVAQIVAQEQCVWGSQSGALQNAAAEGASRRTVPVANGQVLYLESGLAELAFQGGAQVTIEGPASLRLLSGGACDLERGRLLALVGRRAVGFTVHTPNSVIVDRGTEFGVEVSDTRSTDVHVVQGKVEISPPAASGPSAATSPGRPLTLSVGQAVRVSGPSGDKIERMTADKARFARVLAHQPTLPPAAGAGDLSADLPADGEPVRIVWLGNLLDDRRGTRLAAALRSDTYGASAEVGDLAVERVLYGGESLKRIAPRIQFDFAPLGWSDLSWGNVANDAWIAPHTPARMPMDGGGIRTRGTVMTDHEPKIEEGIGTHANALITFDLDEIRSAGNLGDSRLQLVCDRVGLNDDTADDPHSSVHHLVLISTAAEAVTAILDGQRVAITKQGEVAALAGPPPAPVRCTTPHVPVSVDLPTNARYLTLAATCADGRIEGDHVVWSGARLEVVP